MGDVQNSRLGDSLHAKLIFSQEDHEIFMNSLNRRGISPIVESYSPQ